MLHELTEKQETIVAFLEKEIQDQRFIDDVKIALVNDETGICEEEFYNTVLLLSGEDDPFVDKGMLFAQNVDQTIRPVEYLGMLYDYGNEENIPDITEEEKELLGIIRQEICFDEIMKSGPDKISFIQAFYHQTAAIADTLIPQIEKREGITHEDEETEIEPYEGENEYAANLRREEAREAKKNFIKASQELTLFHGRVSPDILNYLKRLLVPSPPGTLDLDIIETVEDLRKKGNVPPSAEEAKKILSRMIFSYKKTMNFLEYFACKTLPDDPLARKKKNMLENDLKAEAILFHDVMSAWLVTKTQNDDPAYVQWSETDTTTIVSARTVKLYYKALNGIVNRSLSDKQHLLIQGNKRLNFGLSLYNPPPSPFEK